MPEPPFAVHRPLLCCALLSAVLLTACNRNPAVRKQKFYDNAIESLKKGQVNKAEVELHSALAVDPNFAEANNTLAEILFRKGNIQEAYKLLRRAEIAQPDYLPARKGLAQLYRAGGRFEDAQREAEYILKNTPDDLDGLIILGAAQKAQKKLDEAEGTFNHVLELQPSQVSALLALASIARENGDLPAAERFLKLARAKNTRSVAVYLALIGFYDSAGRQDEIEPLFTDALKFSNNNPIILQAQADYYIGRKDLAKAEKAARKIHATHPDDPKFFGVLGDFYVQMNQWQKAKTELESVLQQHKDDATVAHKLVEVHMHLNDLKAAEALNEALLKKNPKDAHAHLVKGRFYFMRGDVERAMEQYNETHLYEPDLPALHYWYAQAHLRRGELDQAQQSLETAVKFKPDYREARLSLAQVENQTGATDAALANARMLVKSNPGDVAAMLAFSHALILKKDYARADKVLKFVMERAPRSPEAHLQLGVIDLASKNLSAARKEFTDAWDLRPTSKPLLEDALTGYAMDKQTDAAVVLLKKEIEAHPENALLHYELGRVYLLQNKRAEAVAALQKALSLAPANPDSSVLLADAYVADKKPEQAIQLISASMERYPKDMDLMIKSGMIFEKIQHWDEARKAYERALQIDGANAIAKNNLASVLVDHGGNIDQALKLAQEAKEKLADNLQVTNTIGWIYFKKGIYATAKNYLKECADKDQKNATFQYQLGMTYAKLGNREDARRSLLNALILDPKFAEAQSVRAALAQL